MASRFTPTETSRFFLLGRHGEKDSIAGLPDIEQPLTRTGKSQWRTNGNSLILSGIKPDFILSSSVSRAVESAKQLIATLDTGFHAPPPHQQCGEALYRAYEPEDMMAILKDEFPDEALCPLVIGHNPGMHRLALHLSGQAPASLRQMIDVNFPSAALCLYHMAASSWADLSPRTCQLVGVVSGVKVTIPNFPAPRL